MTKEQAKEAVKVYGWLADGKEVQWKCKADPDWRALIIHDAFPGLDFSYAEFRLKPREPRVIWMWECDSGTHVTRRAYFDNQERALAGCCTKCTITKFMEVLEDGK